MIIVLRSIAHTPSDAIRVHSIKQSAPTTRITQPNSSLRVSANSRAPLPAGKRGAAETPEEQLGVIPLFRSGRGMRAVTVAH